MAIATNPLVPRDGTITITDGAALSLAIAYEDGDFQVSGLAESQLEVEQFEDRGVPYAVRDTRLASPIEFAFAAHAVNLGLDAATATVMDVVRRTGLWAAATSTLASASGDAYLVQVAWVGERTNFGAAADSGLTLKYCRLSADFAEGSPGKISIKGKAFCLSSDYLTVT